MRNTRRYVIIIIIYVFVSHLIQFQMNIFYKKITIIVYKELSYIEYFLKSTAKI